MSTNSAARLVARQARAFNAPGVLASSIRRPAARFISGSGVQRGEEQGGKHNPFGGLGGGYYSDNTKGCYDVIQNAKPMMFEACSAVLASRAKRGAAAKNEPFVIADYGTADAGTSLPMMHELVALIRKSEPTTPVVLAYEDQPQNDWTSVFRRLLGEIPSQAGFDHGGDNQTGAILDLFPNVTMVATGASFYRNCFPPSGVDLMFSATAMHWFRKSPIDMAGVLHSAMLKKSDAEFKPYWDQADADWRLILQQRAKELKVGGRFGCVSFARTEDDYFLGKSSHVKQSMHGRFSDIWADFASKGKITKAEYLSTNFPNQYRCMEEYLAPFGGASGASSETDAPIISAKAGGLAAKSSFEGLHVVGANYGETRCPYHVRWMAEAADRKTKGMDEAKAARDHAKFFVPTTRTWSNSTFESGLSNTRSEAERVQITQDMYQQYEDEIAANPQDHAMDYQHVYLCIEKR